LATLPVLTSDLIMMKAEKYYLCFKSGQKWAMREAAAEAKIYINKKLVDYLGADVIQKQQLEEHLQNVRFDFDDGSYLEMVNVSEEKTMFSWGVFDDEPN